MVHALKAQFLHDKRSHGPALIAIAQNYLDANLGLNQSFLRSWRCPHHPPETWEYQPQKPMQIQTVVSPFSRVVTEEEAAKKPRCELVYAGSGLPQGPFLGNTLFPLKVGLRWGFVNGLEWVQKWVKSRCLGAKVGKNGSKPTFTPTLNPSRGFHENPLFYPV